MFDELKILITGDASGIAATMKQALNIVQGGVSAMNDQTVDWTSIFSRSVSPAIISGVASAFAFAIANAVNFQAAMAMTGTAAGESSNQIAAMSQSALNLSTQVPSSAEDIANAMAQVSSIFSSTADQQQIVTAMSELSAAGFGSLSDIVNAALPIFKQFGVTTTAQGIQVLTELMHSAEAAKESIPSLATAFSQFSDQLPGADKSVSTFNGLISTFGSEIQNLGQAGAQQIFAALANSANNVVGPMELLGTSFSAVQKSLLQDGGLSAIERTSLALQKMGPGASLIATQFGLSATQVGQFQTNASKLPQIAADAKAIATNTQTIGEAYNQAITPLTELGLLWNHFKKDAIDVGQLFTPLITGFAGALNTMLNDADSFFKDLTDGLGSAFSVFFGGNLKSAAQGTFSGLANAFNDVFAKPAQQAANALMGVVGGSTSGPLNSALQSTGVGFSTGQLSSIDSVASQNGLTQSLIDALKSGIKPGQYAQLNSTFNLTVPAGSAGITAKMIATQLYNNFQGTQ